jgi:hypothetical protein
LRSPPVITALCEIQCTQRCSASPPCSCVVIQPAQCCWSSQQLTCREGGGARPKPGDSVRPAVSCSICSRSGRLALCSYSYITMYNTSVPSNARALFAMVPCLATRLQLCLGSCSCVQAAAVGHKCWSRCLVALSYKLEDPVVNTCCRWRCTGLATLLAIRASA